MSEESEYKVIAIVKDNKSKFKSVEIEGTNFRLNPTASIDENKCLFLSYQIMKLAGSTNIVEYTVAEAAAAAPAPAAEEGEEDAEGASASSAAAATADGDKVSVVGAAEAAAEAAAKAADDAVKTAADDAVTKAAADDAVTKAAAEVKAAAAEAAAEDFKNLLKTLQTLLNAVKQLPSVASVEGGAPMQNLMQHIVDNKPNMTSMYPVKVTRRYRTNRRNRKTNRRRRKSYSRR
jgi:hypothetical protein